MTESLRQLEHDFGWEGLRSFFSNRHWSTQFESNLELGFRRFSGHGRFETWKQLLSQLPRVESPHVELDACAPRATWNAPQHLGELEHILRALGPWKKGPFNLQGINIDAEWRSNLKWNRVLEVAHAFEGRRVLDVGTGNGYFLYRAKGEGAKYVLGLEPSAHYCAQYLALQTCYQVREIAMLPITSDEFEQGCKAFDTVLSMGVLYHRRSPLDHLAQLRGFLVSRGQLLLETIVVDGDEGYSLIPKDRYAQMRNVWFLPTIKTLTLWLKRIGFLDVTCSKVVPTTSEEQRSTSWTEQPSLRDFLDPENSALTREGYPAPQRVIVSAIAP